jgi:hypothetical protein
MVTVSPLPFYQWKRENHPDLNEFTEIEDDAGIHVRGYPQAESVSVLKPLISRSLTIS